MTAGAGVAVGLLRRLTNLPETIPSLLADLKEQRVDAKLVPGIVVVSAVSLIGGASLGPEKPLGSLGGGAGTWLSKRRGLSEEDAQLNTLSGFAGAYGGLFSVTVGVVALIVEVAHLARDRYAKALLGTIVASSVSFGIYFAIAGSVFLDAYTVPPYEFESWQLLAGVPLGLLAAVLVTLLAVIVKVAAGLFGRLEVPGIVKSTLGGAVFGLVGVALPLTLFTGSDQLKTVVNDAGTLGLGLIVALVIAKMVTFAVSEASGFIGGPIFPALFIGGTAGVAVHEIFPGRATRTCVHLPVRRRAGQRCRGAVLVRAARRVHDAGRGAADRPHHDRRRHRVAQRGGRQVPPRHPPAGTCSCSEIGGPFKRKQRRRMMPTPGLCGRRTRAEPEA